MKKSVFLLLLFVLVWAGAETLFAQSVSDTRAEQLVEVESGGATRRALLFLPDAPVSSGGAPLVFVFHGRSGTMEGAAKRMPMHDHWREAIVVYPQGMWVEGGLRDGFGWVMPTADDEGRDIAFFDVLLAEIAKRHSVDLQRVYAMGHSNGGGFTHALWVVRGECIAAVAPSASGAGNLRGLAEQQPPKPAFFVAGEADDIVPLWRVQKSIERTLAVNGCCKGKKISNYHTLYRGADGADVESYIHPGGHKFNRESLPLIARFFARHKRD